MSQPHTKPDHESSTGMPRWVKVFGIIILVLVLLVVILQFTGGGRHGPGRHLPSGDAGGSTARVGITALHPALEGSRA